MEDSPTHASGSRATVIGAGIGGLLAALALEKRGWNVHLVDEKAGAPSPFDLPYVCSKHVIDFLEREMPEVLRDLETNGVRRISIAEILRERFPETPITAQDERTAFLCTSRSQLQKILFDHVKRTDIKLEAFRVSKLLFERDDVVGVEFANSSRPSLLSDVVLDATGSKDARTAWLESSRPDRACETVETYGPSYTSVAQFYRVSQTQERKHVHFNLARGQNFRGGIYPLEGDRFALALIAPKFGATADMKQTQLFFDRAIESIPGTRDLLARATPERALQVLDGIRNRSSNYYDEPRLSKRLRRFLPLGDSILSGNPIYGRGVSLLVLQLRGLLEALDAGADWDSLQQAVGDGVRRGRRYWLEGALADKGEVVSNRMTDRVFRTLRSGLVTSIISQLDTNPELTRRFLYNYQLLLPAWRITRPQDYWTAALKFAGMSK